MAVGRLAREAKLPIPTDWVKGWIWSWRGRRTHIHHDFLSGHPANFAGHISLKTREDELVSFIPDQVECKNTCEEFLIWVTQKNRGKLEAWSSHGTLITDDVTSHHAIEAGIEVIKYPIFYSPTRLKDLLSNPKYVQMCKYAWNVDIRTHKLNCNTFFQAWHVTKDLPWAPKLSDHHQMTEMMFGHTPLSHEDKEFVCQKAYSQNQFHLTSQL